MTDTAVTDAVVLLKSEYEDLREEIRTHQTLSSAIVTLDVTALGAGISIGSRSPIVLLVLSVVNSLFWLRYIEHVTGIFRAASFIYFVLRPRLSELVGGSVLLWEHFLREIRHGGAAGAGVLPRSYPRERLGGRMLGFSDTSSFFALASPLLIAGFLYTSLRQLSHDEPLVWVGAAAAALLVVYSIARVHAATAWIRDLERAITDDRLDCQAAGSEPSSIPR